MSAPRPPPPPPPPSPLPPRPPSTSTKPALHPVARPPPPRPTNTISENTGQQPPRPLPSSPQLSQGGRNPRGILPGPPGPPGRPLLPRPSMPLPPPPSKLSNDSPLSIVAASTGHGMKPSELMNEDQMMSASIDPPPSRPVVSPPPLPKTATSSQKSEKVNGIQLGDDRNSVAVESNHQPASLFVNDETNEVTGIETQVETIGKENPHEMHTIDKKVENREDEKVSRRSVKFSDIDEVALINDHSTSSSTPSSSASSSTSSPATVPNMRTFSPIEDSSVSIKNKAMMLQNPPPVAISRSVFESLQSELHSAQEQILTHVRQMADAMKIYREELEQSNIDDLIHLIRKPPSTQPRATIDETNSDKIMNDISLVAPPADENNRSFIEIDTEVTSALSTPVPTLEISGNTERQEVNGKDDPFIPHDDAWKELSLVNEKKMTWADIKEALQLRNTVLRAALGNGRSRKQQEDILQKVDKELSQPKKIKDLTNIDSASKMLEEYFQHGEYLLLYRVAAYDEILRKATVNFPRHIQEALQEVQGQFEQLRERQVHQNLHKLYQQEVELIQALWAKKRDQIMQQEQLKAALLAETLEWGLQKEEELYERYRHHENLQNIRDKYLNQVDAFLMQSYNKIYQRLQRESPTQGIALEKMYDQLNAIRRGTLVWKQQFSRRLEDRLHNIELVIDGYYMSFMEELVEQLQELHKVNTMATCYAEQLTAHLTSVAIKVLDGGMKRPEQEAFNSFQSFQLDGKDRKPLLKLGTSIQSLAALADIPHDDTARVLTAMLFATTKDRVKDPSVPRDRQVLFG